MPQTRAMQGRTSEFSLSFFFEGIDCDVTIGPDFYVTSSSHSTSGVWVRQFAPNRDDTSAKRSDLSRTIMGPAVKGLAAVQSKVD